jgi:hypothetical protein
MVPSVALRRPISPVPPSNDVVGTLGSDPGASIALLVHEFMQEKHDECAGNREKIAVFCKSHDELVNQAWARISAYEKACVRYRLKNKLRRFDWSYESQDVIRALLRKKKNQKESPLKPSEKATRLDASYERQAACMWRQPFKSKIPLDVLLYEPQGDIASGSYYRDAKRRGVDTAPSLNRPGYKPNQNFRKVGEPLESVMGDVVARYLSSGVFRSVQNTKR